MREGVMLVDGLKPPYTSLIILAGGCIGPSKGRSWDRRAGCEPGKALTTLFTTSMVSFTVKGLVFDGTGKFSGYQNCNLVLAFAENSRIVRQTKPELRTITVTRMSK